MLCEELPPDLHNELVILRCATQIYNLERALFQFPEPSADSQPYAETLFATPTVNTKLLRVRRYRCSLAAGHNSHISLGTSGNVSSHMEVITNHKPASLTLQQSNLANSLYRKSENKCKLSTITYLLH